MIRPAKLDDVSQIFTLYKKAARNIGGIARTESEVTLEYVQHNLDCALTKGLAMVIEEDGFQRLIGEIHACPPEPNVFSHVLSELTIVVDPESQSSGYGKKLFTEFLSVVESRRPDILRVELIARESNTRAISFYQSIGFHIEGRFEKRIGRADGTFEADIPMAWFNKNYGMVRGVEP